MHHMRADAIQQPGQCNRGKDFLDGYFRHSNAIHHHLHITHTGTAHRSDDGD